MTREEAENTYGLPAGTEIKGQLLKWFRAQLEAMLGTVPDIGAPLPTHFPPLADYDDPMASAMTPILSMYWDAGGKQVLERIGLDPNVWQVVDPHTQAKIQAAAFAFCQSTNATTSKQLNVALAELRTELVEGIVQQGDSLKQLRKRVMKVFDHAEKWRAEKIAASEASRAVHAAELQSAEESGVVAGLEWLASADACPLCQMVAAEAHYVQLGHDFAHVGHNPHYSKVKHPPLHPSCQCSVLEVLKPEYGGPENVPWSTPLDQPKPKPGYEPPEPPKPQPGVRAPYVEPAVATPKPAKPRPTAEDRARQKIEKARTAQRAANKPPDAASQWRKENWLAHPDLVHPVGFTVKERLRDYKLGNAKADAVKDLEKAAQKRKQEIQTELDRLAGEIHAQTTEASRLSVLQIDAMDRGDNAEANRLGRAILALFETPEVKRLVAAQKKLEAERKVIDKKTREAAFRVLSLPAGEQLSIQHKACEATAASDDGPLAPVAAGSCLERNLDKALTWLKGFTAKGDTASQMEQRVGQAAGRRAHRTNGTGQGYEIQLDSTEDESTIAHEFGHAIDRLVTTKIQTRWGEETRTVVDSTLEFLKHRIGNEAPEKFKDLWPNSTYKPWEKGCEDKFGKAAADRHEAYYAGKVYNHKSAEVLTIGIELLYRDPVRFAEKDREWFKFVVGVLDGSLR